MTAVATQAALYWNPSFVAFLAVIGCDAVFGAYFTFRPRGKAERPRQAPLSRVGMVFQSVACMLVGMLHRSPRTPVLPMPIAGQVAIAVFATALAVVSTWLCFAAVHALGKQWTYVAQVGDGHQLITHGPYGRLRHPIYTGMTGLVIASALVADYWWAIPVVVILQFAGSFIRINQEEKLLRETHGEAFETYAARVPAIIPRWRMHPFASQCSG
jgi:protein-S-isoprenylcysteine O-methyltransferase Ste14